MKKPLSISLLFIGFVLSASVATAQVNHISTAAGNGTAGFSGDGGPATAAELNNPTDVCEDHAGNLYIVDHGNNRIRKVNAVSHIITTIAGTGVSGYTGDGGPATAATLSTPNGIVVDGADNLYIADEGNNVIRKVSASGLITTIAGTGAAGFSGDGGAALAAQFNIPSCIAVDGMYNLYIGDKGNHRIRKINAATGIITTIAGGGPSGFSTDGVPATSVNLCALHHLSVDALGNIYFTNQGCVEYLKIDPAGLIYMEENITTPWGVCNDIAGNVYMCTHGDYVIRKNAAGTVIDTIVNGGHGFAGDGGDADTAKISSPDGIYADIIGNIYLADAGNNRVRFITSSIIATYNADSFSVFVNELCGGPQLIISANRYGTDFNQTTYFGDGTSSSSAILPGYGGTAGYSTFTHVYSLPGTYTLKTIFRNGTAIIDSYVYSYQCKMCNIIQGKFYVDGNSSMAYEPGVDVLSCIPTSIEIDSNGVIIDTITATSGFYYTANGIPGDIYRLKIISSGGGLIPTSPSSGIILDTVRSGIYNVDIKDFGLSCSGIPGIDLRVHTANRVGVHRFGGDIIVDNLYCSSISSPAIVTVKVSPKYLYHDALPVPTTVDGNTLTWDFSSITSAMTPTSISLHCEKPSGMPSYSPGDTVHSMSIIGPTTGDADTSNNTIIVIDTVKSGYDPNFMEVSPAGYIPAGTKLQYTIGFENTGNDTAHNIYVLDTLSDNADPSTLSIVTASAAMDIFTYTYAGHTVVKFDFPAINILDSSHHDQCTGMVVFTVKTRAGLPDCTHILNEAGIYFDENPVVMTNAVENITGPPPVPASLSGASSVCISEMIPISTDIPGGTWSTNNSNAIVSTTGNVTGISSGSVIVYYTVPAACGPVTSMYEINVGLPSAGYIVSSAAICAGSSISLASTAAGGVWTAYNTYATVSGSTLTAVTPGVDTVYYTVTTACGTATTEQVVTIETNPVVGAIAGPTGVCIGSTITLTDSVSGGVWSSTPEATISATGVVTGVSSGLATIIYTITNSCGTVSITDKINVVNCSATGYGNVQVENAVQVFPNPADDQLTILGDETAYTSCAITNTLGQTLITQNIAAAQTQVNVKMLPAGMYYITLKGARGNMIFKFLKR